MPRGIVFACSVALVLGVVCASPAVARSTGCAAIDQARARGMSEEEIKVLLQTTTGKIRACDQVTAVHARMAAHRARAEAYRANLARRFAP